MYLYIKKRRGRSKVCSENTCTWRSFLALLGLSIGSTLGVKHDVLLVFRSEIFEFVALKVFQTCVWGTWTRFVGNKEH